MMEFLTINNLVSLINETQSYFMIAPPNEQDLKKIIIEEQEKLK